jgi:hypothetical protein
MAWDLEDSTFIPVDSVDLNSQILVLSVYEVYTRHFCFAIKKTHLLRQPFCSSSSASSTDET